MGGDWAGVGVIGRDRFDAGGRARRRGDGLGAAFGGLTAASPRVDRVHTGVMGMDWGYNWVDVLADGPTMVFGGCDGPI